MTSAPMSMPDSNNKAPGRSDELLRLLVDSALEHAIVLLDREGRVTWWSKGAERVFAVSREQAVGMPVAEIFTPLDQRSGIAELERAVAGADAISEDDRWHLRADGGRFWASGALIALRGPTGEVLGFGKIVRDRTDVKEQIVALQSQLEEARRSDTTKDRVIAKVAHELRNLFAGLNSGLQVMRSHAGDEQRQQQVMALMQQQLQIVRSLTEDLLDAQRFRAGKATLDVQQTVLQQVLSDALEHLRSRATFDDTDAIVHVEDTGKGIAPELLPRVFDMFTQADTATSGGGLGIGLALVHELVRLHGGSVQAVSLGLGRGSEFTVRLPLQRIAAPGNETPA
jgi:PAS domain S-box-containing protein